LVNQEDRASVGHVDEPAVTPFHKMTSDEVGLCAPGTAASVASMRLSWQLVTLSLKPRG
jgi:hypothetical protein